MQVYLTVIVIVVGILFVAWLLGKRNEHAAETAFRNKMKKSWGQEPDLGIMEGRRKAIPKYYENHKEAHFLDDITWNDLGMDNVYDRVNYCHSGAGQEYLYYMLRCPQQTDDYTEMEEHIANFTNKEDVRVEAQLIFAKMANYGKYSLYDYLGLIDDLRNTSNLIHIVPDVLLLIGIIGCFVKFELFFIPVLLILGYNVITYFRTKGDIQPYLSTFGYILRMLQGSSMFSEIKDDVLKKETDKLTEYYKTMAHFRRGAWILLDPARLSNSGDPINMFLDYVCMFTHLDLIKFNTMLGQVRHHSEAIDGMVTVLGRIESEISIACYRASLNGKYCIPVFKTGEQGDTGYEGAELYHPNMSDPVVNSISVEKGVLITGSNASGKSTFLKTCAIAAVMAQSLHTVTGTKYSAPMYRIYSSMALRDDLAGGESYYIVEIKSLKRILDVAETEGNRILCLIDEVLRGTNTIERIAASTQILKSLNHHNIQCFAATHDIELTQLLQDDYDNFHFRGEVTDSDVHFTYKLMTGPATNRNAIKLLSIIGYDRSIVDKAQDMAERFGETGIWSN